MDHRTQVFLLLIFAPVLILANHQTSILDVTGLTSLMALWTNTPPSWRARDPCEDGWDGIQCTNMRVVSLKLSSMNLTGTLSGDIEQLSELQVLDLSYNKGLNGPLPTEIGSLKKLTNIILVGCSFSGRIPPTIGSLQELIFLSLNSNKFGGKIPSSIGNLSKLYWLDLADNNLEGDIPVSDGGEPGLDMLSQCKHFHLGKNRLSGEIPSKLFNSNMNLLHVLFDSNQLIGSIPSSLGLVQTLEVVRLDGNRLSGPIPPSLNNLTSVSQLFLSNNKLSGPPPDLIGMNLLHYVDLSNNSFDVSGIPPWISTLESLTTLIMEGTQLQGEIPTALFSLSNIQTVVLRNNQLNGTLVITSSSQLELIDLQKNLISEYNGDGGYNGTLILVQNPVCEETGASPSYCKKPSDIDPYETMPNNCVPSRCGSDQVSSPNCKCGYPYEGTLIFRAPTFSDLENATRYKELEKALMKSFLSHQLSVDSVSLSNVTKDSLSYLKLGLAVFPQSQDLFNRKEVSSISFLLSNQTFKPPKSFGPFYFIGDDYLYFAVPSESKKSSNVGIIIGAAAGGSVLVLVLILVGIYAIHQKRRAKRATDENNPFSKWDVDNKSRGSVPQMKGARSFSFEELMQYSNNFSEENDVGSGGYGKVYRGILPTGKLIATKRAHTESIQGGHQFKSEIELLSRVHHKNLVSLVGFCFDRGEQMLVYEYVPNGTLKDSLSGKSGIRLDWQRRLKIALGAARGLAYLHELCDPPIIHRDIKSTNVLLDSNLTAKVSDFGLSKSMGDSGRDHVSTQVKGTMGYMDPEYYTTQRLTEKSDVYGFGVLILVQNPVCEETGASPSYCKKPSDIDPYETMPNNCVPSRCGSDQVSSPNCKCGYPYEGTLIFRAPTFSDLENATRYKELEKALMKSFLSHQLSVDSVSLSNVTKDSLSYLKLGLAVFPQSQDLFNRKEVSSISFLLSNQTFKPPKSFGPFYFIGDDYLYFAEPSESKKSSNVGIIIGAAAGGSVLVLVLILVGIYAIHQKRRAKRATDESNPFSKWDVDNKSRGSVPQMKGARSFSFEELMQYSNNFSEENDVGSGGYGKVYRGILPTGKLIATKRAHTESIQGGHQFKSEIELLSRVHHKNLVSLVGFCFDRGEQMLVYEYVPNGTLKDSLSGKSGIRLDWQRRLKIALGAARGLAYLHELCDPPIIHRDIKSTNVLLDSNLTAKVSDFGLSKSMGDSGRDHVSTQVKGTMGYMDPEYYTTQRLTEKSDVYGFGVLMLELLTARKPIEQGKYIVREVKMAMDKTKELYNLHVILDTTIGLSTTLIGLERFVDLAMTCVEEEGVNRPTMGEVVKEIENIMQLAGLNPNAESASTSASYDDKASTKHPYSEEVFDYSGGFPASKIEPL